MALHLSTESFWSVSVHNLCSVSMTNVQQLYVREFVKKPSSKSCFLSMVQLKAWFGMYQICQLLLKHPWQQYIMDGSRCSCRDVPPLPPPHTVRPCIIFPPEYSPTAGLTCTTSPLCAGKVWSRPCAKPSAYHLPVERQRVGHQEDQV